MQQQFEKRPPRLAALLCQHISDNCLLKTHWDNNIYCHPEQARSNNRGHQGDVLCRIWGFYNLRRFIQLHTADSWWGFKADYILDIFKFECSRPKIFILTFNMGIRYFYTRIILWGHKFTSNRL